MSWFHRITFTAMWAAVWVLKDRANRKHQDARVETDPIRQKALRAQADALTEQAEGIRLAYHERQEGKQNRD